MKVAACALLLAVAAPAWAAGEDTALLPVEVHGKVPEQIVAKVNRSLANRAGGLAVVDADERAHSKHDECKVDPACWAEVGRDLGYERVLAATLSAGPHPERYQFEALLIDVGTGKVVGRASRSVPRGSASNMPGKVVAELLWSAPRIELPPPEKPKRPPSAEDELPPGAEPPPVMVPYTLAEVAQIVIKRDATAPSALIGARIGLSIPQAFSTLGTSFLVEVEGAYQLPFWHRRLGLFLGVSYTQPGRAGNRAADTRLVPNNGLVSYDLTLDELGFDLGVQLRYPIGRWIVPYAGVGAELLLTRATLQQHAGRVDFGTVHEQSMHYGVLARVGAGLHLGPGDVVLELQIHWAPLSDFQITGDNNTGHLAFQLGYLIRI